ncbi:MAG: type II secretion system secretin GspD [Candidatus Binatia bacterium]
MPIDGEKTLEEPPVSDLQSQTLVVADSGIPDAPSPSLLHRTAAQAEKKKSSQTPSQAENPDAGEPKTAPIPPTRRHGVTAKTGSATEQLVSLNFSQVDLVEIIHVLAQHLKLTYTIDPKVKGTVTIHSAEPLRKEDLLPIFHQILRMNNAVAVKTGDLYRIIPIEEGKGVVRPAAKGTGDSYALQVLPVRFLSVTEMKKLLTPFITPGGEILDYPRGNFLIVMDLPSNIQRLKEIKDLIDVNVFAGVRMELYQPKIASADDLAGEMTKIMQAYAASATQAENFAAEFISLPRTNKLLVISHSEAAWTYVKRWLDRIDVLTEGPGRRIFIYPVENGKATDLADILNQVYGTSTVAAKRETLTLKDFHGTLSGGSRGGSLSGTSATTPGSPTAAGGSSGLFAVTPAPTPAPSRRPSAVQAQRGAAPVVASSPGKTENERIRIVADPATNSLIIFGTTQEYQNIKGVLKKLDLVPRQVLMDVLVAEVTLTDDLAFGVDYAIRRKGSVKGVSPSLEGKGSLTGTLPLTFPTGLTSIITSGDDFRAILNALMEDSKVKVLSHPAILAADNRPARIQVGSEEPIATGSTTAQVGTAASSTTIQFRNLGRILTIIPQVNSKGLVHLQVKVEVSERGDLVQVGADQFFSFDTRDAETTAVVQDGDTLTIGGIITERKSRDRTGIPYLMDIPVLGRFFGLTTDKVERTELVILITPHVMRNREEAQAVTKEFLEKVSTVKRELERVKKEEAKKREKGKTISPTPIPAAPPKKQGKVDQKKTTVTDPLDKSPAATPTITKESLHEVKKEIQPERPKSEPPVMETSAVVLTKETAVSPRTGVAQSSGTTGHRRVLWTVQVSAFPFEPLSRELAQRLMKQGYDAYTTKANVKGRTWYRVRVGRLATRRQAKKLKESLVKAGNFSQAFITFQ